MDSDLLTESNKERLSRSDIKWVARATLEVLKVLHADGLVHTDVKLDNIFVNHSTDGSRFSNIKLGDCGGVVPEQSDFAKEGHLIGAVVNRSPEASLGVRWGTSTDIWSFGTCILSLLYGGNYHLLNPGIEGVKPGDELYEFTIFKRLYKFFGPWPASFKDFEDNDHEVMTLLDFFNNLGPPEKPLQRVTTKELPPADKVFILRVMKLDPRDRPTAQALLEDDWFNETSEDTRAPL
ncbi:hypothetical protein N0V93_006039 [Gnomoniopsis smithogilvyi]|uniref:Protein kinase domain-containing protein n=1 Tax=Gnomoniopsis smithogilvyi TaxID=1191159 RepID=A0A9W9CV79_9PEZI|nr:hypothetical protein N0V93_006039 [Gnomoniopsis smithogilvyi]